MRVLMINPNTTVSMTDKIAAAARHVCRPDTEIIATNPAEGPASIEGYHDVAMSIPGMLAEIRNHKDIDGVVIGCFDDTGLDAARCQTKVPVVGIGEAAFHAASFLACKFSVITTLRRSVPGIEANLQRYGLAARCARVRATEIPVLKLEENDPATLNQISREIERAIEEDAAEAIVLGCAGMADLMENLSATYAIPVIDGVACGIAFAEALGALKMTTSKIGGYAPPATL